MKKRWILVAAPLVIFASCPSLFRFSYDETADSVVVLRPGTVRPYEIELRKTVVTSGNMHGPSNPFSPPRTERSADFIYLNQAEGGVPAADLVFTHWQGCTDPVWWQANMKGSLTVQGDSIRIDLFMPRYEGSSSVPSEHVPWQHNGTYRLVHEPAPANLSPAVCGMP